MTEPDSFQSRRKQHAPSSCSHAFANLTILAGLGWIALLALASPIVWFIQDTSVIAFGATPQIWPAVLANLGQVMLWLVPLIAAALWWQSRSPRHAAVLATWALAALLPLVWLPQRFFAPSVHPDMAPTSAAIQLGGLSVFYLLLRWWRKKRGLAALPPRRTWLPALLVSALLMAGWWYVGAFGSLPDLLLHLLLGLYFGHVLGFLLGHFLLQPLYETSTGSGRDIALGTLGVAGVLAIAGASCGFGGQSALFLLVLPSIAWPLMGSLRLGGEPDGRSWGSAARIIGLVMATMLVSVDVDELTQLLLGSQELGVQLLLASSLTVVISGVIGAILWLARSGLPRLRPGPPFQVVTGLVWAGVLAVLFLKPNAGFHGDQLFVILGDQADLSAASDIDDVDQRRQTVYASLVNQANETQAPLRRRLARLCIEYQPYYLVNAIQVQGGPLARLWLGRQPEVDRVLHNPQLRPLAPSTAQGRLVSFGLRPPEASPQARPPDVAEWNLVMIGADRVWQELGVRGAGVTLGESDSGVQWDHPELADSYRGRDSGHDYNWMDAWYNQPTPYDRSGHGTHTTATAVGNHVGVAPDAEWFACANLVRDLGNPGDYVACMQFMLAPTPLDGNPLADGDPALAADVLNNSWGCPTLEGCDPEALQTAVAALRTAGIFVVASAGNEGEGDCGTVSDPIALYETSFTVGAHDKTGAVAPFSSRGPVSADGSQRTKPDLLAPGVGILSAAPGSQYLTHDGTSMAGPHVAGVVALMWSANPRLIGDIEATERILVETATPYDYGVHGIPPCGDPAVTPDNAVGYGLVNAYEAVKAALAHK